MSPAPTYRNIAWYRTSLTTNVSHQVDTDFVKLGLKPLQSAYKSRNRTETTLIVVFNRIVNELDKNDHAVLFALLDVSATFDTVDHIILLKRLRNTYGVRQNYSLSA